MKLTNPNESDRERKERNKKEKKGNDNTDDEGQDKIMKKNKEKKELLQKNIDNARQEARMGENTEPDPRLNSDGKEKIRTLKKSNFSGSEEAQQEAETKAKKEERKKEEKLFLQKSNESKFKEYETSTIINQTNLTNSAASDESQKKPAAPSGGGISYAQPRTLKFTQQPKKETIEEKAPQEPIVAKKKERYIDETPDIVASHPRDSRIDSKAATREDNHIPTNLDQNMVQSFVTTSTINNPTKQKILITPKIQFGKAAPSISTMKNPTKTLVPPALMNNKTIVPPLNDLQKKTINSLKDDDDWDVGDGRSKHHQISKNDDDFDFGD